MSIPISQPRMFAPNVGIENALYLWLRAFSMLKLGTSVLIQIPTTTEFFKRLLKSSRISTPIGIGT